ncbi:unnamed protein product [Adineta steineri]|uniref:AB hydrolase-1 domain-containing protein n=1 Tax=Adineta steineri TaxID=433720 RepID=A0A813XTJ7_9BILA|nr:unnamed protein product [Adineta steineri]CAF3750302.1 unnamed protein product [Adineta steineri]
MPHLNLSAVNQNLKLYYEIHGSGENKILLIMGLLTEGAAWSRQIEFFAAKSDYQCVTYDNRGCGRSFAPLFPYYTTSQMAKDALALIDHLQWKQCHVVGISMGGMIALEFALLAPKRILSLTLLATHAGGLSGQAPFAGINHILQSMLLRDENAVIENVMAMLYSKKTLADPEKRKSFYDYHIERFRKRIPPSLSGLIGHLAAVVRHYISYADLLKIRYSPFECLIMVGTEDRLVREANSYMLQRVLGCRLIKCDGAGHGLQGECVEEINQELFKMFESVRKNDSIKKSDTNISNEHQTEILALEQCCQHRTHCLVYDITGFVKGLFLGMILYSSLSIVGLTKTQLAGIHLTFESVILLACLNGLRRSIACVFRTFRARQFVKKHHLQLDRATHEGGIGITLPEKSKTGIPSDCGFEFPIHSLIVIANLIGIIYWLRPYGQKI